MPCFGDIQLSQQCDADHVSIPLSVHTVLQVYQVQLHIEHYVKYCILAPLYRILVMEWDHHRSTPKQILFG